MSGKRRQAETSYASAVQAKIDVIWPKLNCLKPSLLAATYPGFRRLVETGVRKLILFSGLV
jgi:hypothetical protein